MGCRKWFLILIVFIFISRSIEFRITSGRQDKVSAVKKHVPEKKVHYQNDTRSIEDKYDDDSGDDDDDGDSDRREKSKRDINIVHKLKKTEKVKFQESEENDEDVILKHKARFKIDIKEYDDPIEKKEEILSEELIKSQVRYSVVKPNVSEKNVTKHGKAPFKFEAMFKEVPKSKDTSKLGTDESKIKKDGETKQAAKKEEAKSMKKETSESPVTKIKRNITKIATDDIEKKSEEPTVPKPKIKPSVDQPVETKKEKQLKPETKETTKPDKEPKQKETPVKPTKPSKEVEKKLKSETEEKIKKSEKPVKDKKDPKTQKKIVDTETKVKQKPEVKTKTVQKHKNEIEVNQARRHFERLYYSLPTFAPNYSRIINEECRIQGQILLRQLKGSKLWALQMLDSTGKIPSSILRGNLNQLGDYDQCLAVNARVKLPDSPDMILRIKGKYCLVHIDLEATADEMRLPVNLAQARTFIKSKYHDPGHFIPRFTTLKWGLCLPDLCKSEDAEQTFHDTLRPYNHSDTTGFKIHVHVDEDDCFVQRKQLKLSDYSIETIITIGFYTIVVVIAAVSTFRDIFGWSDELSNKGENLLMAFSLKRTINSLFKNEPQSDDIQCIHGLRVLCTFMLYIAHKLLPIANIPISNRAALTELANSSWTTTMRGSLIYTDTFLLISGVLTAYHMSREMDTKGHIHWVNRMISRFIRLTPALLATLLFYANIFEYIGEGPQWNTVVNKNAELCKENWWKNIFYIQNFYPFEEMCATHTHQLALDMQLTLLAPILVWFLYKKPLTGLAVATGLHAMSVGLRYYTTLNNHLSLFIYHGMTISQLIRTANKCYAQSIYRATPYIAGVSLGVVLRQISKRDFTMPKIVIAGGWLLATYFGGWTLYTPTHLAQRDYVYDVEEAAQYAALCSIAWSLAVSWIIFYCYVESNGVLNSFLGSYPMLICSRISYSIYLTQFAVFFYNVGTTKTSIEFSVLRSVDLIEFVVILFISIVLTLLLDIPMQDVKDIIIGKNQNKETQEESEQTDEMKKESEELQTIEEADEDISVSEKVDDKST